MKKLTLIAALLLAPAAARADCGDNELESGEACDDGNTIAGDGCSVTCTIEAGFACRTQTPVDIKNGSFEFPIETDWTVVGFIDHLSPGTPVCYPAFDGTRSVDINGASRGEIFQDVGTTVGRRYVVTFYGSANCREGATDACTLECERVITLSAGPGGALSLPPHTTATYTTRGMPLAIPYQLYTFEFRAISPMTRLRFSGTDASLAGSILDLVASPTSVCTRTSCGDGTMGAGETCDDGNSVGGDGCSASCRLERGYMCPSPGEPCKPDCGDGLKVEGEECDDGDRPAMGGDGCSTECTIEDGWACTVDPLEAISVCAETCGDGALDPGEACDDGNDVDTDACSNSCRRGPGAACMLDSECNLSRCLDGAVCGGCYDLGAGTDFGCGGLTPHCLTGPDPLCVQCVVDADCGADGPCNTTTHTCATGPQPDGGPGDDDAGIGDDDGGVPSVTDGGVISPPAPRPDAGPGVTGGAGCSASPSAGTTPGAPWLLALAALGLVLRRRR